MTVASATPSVKPSRAQSEREAASNWPRPIAMAGSAVLPVIADVNRSPSLRKLSTSVHPEASDSEARPRFS
jgi:hypothetical protein